VLVGKSEVEVVTKVDVEVVTMTEVSTIVVGGGVITEVTSTVDVVCKTLTSTIRTTTVSVE
jgi:hypothetical protein